VQQDIVLVPAQGWMRLRVRFTDYPGRSVYHCHILDHEDAGMMATAHVHG
jgi:FtsP/CotA-like multicopper oxidase with cupredoxin domain